MKKRFKLLTPLLSVMLIVSIMIIPSFLYACKTTGDDVPGGSGTGGSGNTGTIGLPGDGEAADYDYTSKEVADAIIAAYPASDIPDGGLKYYFSGADKNSDDYIDPDQIGGLVDGNWSTPAELAYLEDYAFYTPAGARVFEIDVMRVAKDETGNIDAVKNMLERRLARKDTNEVREYMPQDVPLITNAKVIAIHNYVILLVTKL